MSILGKLADALATGGSANSRAAANAIADSASSSARRAARMAGAAAEKAQGFADDASNVMRNRAKQLATDSYIKRFSNLGGDIIGEGKSLTDTLGRNLWDRLSADKVGVTNLENYATNAIKPLSDLYSDVLGSAKESGVKASVKEVRKRLSDQFDKLSTGQTAGTRRAMKEYLNALDSDLLGSTYAQIAPQQKALADLTGQIEGLNAEIANLPTSSRSLRTNLADSLENGYNLGSADDFLKKYTKDAAFTGAGKNRNIKAINQELTDRLLENRNTLLNRQIDDIDWVNEKSFDDFDKLFSKNELKPEDIKRLNQTVKDVSKKYKNVDELVDDLVDPVYKTLRSADYNGGVDIVPILGEGGHVDGYKRVSQNSSLYKNLYNEYGATPTKTQVRDALKEYLTGADRYGFDEMAYMNPEILNPDLRTAARQLQDAFDFRNDQEFWGDVNYVSEKQLGELVEGLEKRAKALEKAGDNEAADYARSMAKDFEKQVKGGLFEDVANNTLKEKQQELKALGQQRSQLNKEIQEALDSATVDYDDLRKIRQTVKSKSADISAQGINASADDRALKKFYDEMARDLDDVIDTGLADFGQEMGLRQRLIKAMTANGSDPNLVKKYMDAADDAVNISTIRKEMAPYMFAKDVLTATRRGTEKAADLGGVLGKVGNIPVVGEAINRLGEAGNVGKQKLYESIASGTAADATKKAINLAKKAGIGVLGASVLAQMMGGNGSGQDISGEYAQANNTDQSGINQPTANSALEAIVGGGAVPSMGGVADSEEYINALLYGTPLPTGSDAVAPSQLLNGYSLDDYRNAYVAALLDGNTYMADIYKNIMAQFDNSDDIDAQLDRQYKQLQIQQLQQKINSANSTATTGDQKKAAALNTIQSLMNNYEAQGPIGGRITGLLNAVTGGSYNPSVYAYESGAKGSLGSIIKALGDSGALSEGDQQRALNLIPSTNDSPAAARKKYQQLMNILQTSSNNDTFIIAGQ